jgi:hypothetical protein
MIRFILAMGISLCTAGCGITSIAIVNYVHSPNAPPPPGTVFVELPENDPDYPVDAADAYGWLGMYGYQKALSVADATYILRIEGKSAQQVCGYETVGTDVNGNEQTAWECDMAFVPELHIFMWRRAQSQAPKADSPFVEVDVKTGDRPPYSATTMSRLLEFAFTVFPGVEGGHEGYFLKKTGSLVCVESTRPIAQHTIYHCRAPDAAAGVLSSAPAS